MELNNRDAHYRVSALLSAAWRAFCVALLVTAGCVQRDASAQHVSPAPTRAKTAKVTVTPQAPAAVLYLQPAAARTLATEAPVVVPYLNVRPRVTRAQPRLATQTCLTLTQAFSGSEVVNWNAVALEVIRDVKPPPPVVARNLALLNTAMYDAWASYEPFALSTTSLDRVRRPVAEHTLANKRIAVNYAAYSVLRDLWPQHGCLYEDQLLAAGLQPTPTVPITLNTPVDIGLRATARLMAFRHNDGSNQLNGFRDTSGYRPVNAPLFVEQTFQVTDANRWQPLMTPSGSNQGGACDPDGQLITQTHVVPHFGSVHPFALNDGAPITATRGPAKIGTAEFDAQALELLRISADLNDERKSIAEYWADGPASELPPGHWTLVAMYVAQRDANALDDDIKMFFAMTNAVMDAGIHAWKFKRLYDNSRPITAMRFRYRTVNVRAWRGPGLGVGSIPGRTWTPFQQICFITPPFAEFVSGHSTFSAAAAEVLKTFTGSDALNVAVVIPEGSSLVEPQVTPSRTLTLTYPTFTSAADAAGISRRYGGIHFSEADVQGRVMGREIGRRAWARATFYFSNTQVLSQSVYLPMALQLR